MSKAESIRIEVTETKPTNNKITNKIKNQQIIKIIKHENNVR
jgi:hypothetical protein